MLWYIRFPINFWGILHPFWFYSSAPLTLYIYIYIYHINPAYQQRRCRPVCRVFQNNSCSDSQQHSCRFIYINSKHLIAHSTMDESPAELLHWEIYMLLWVICMLPLIHSEVHTSALLTFSIYYYLSHRQHIWRVNNHFFQCFGDLNPNQTILEQVRRPGLRSTYSFHKIGNIYFSIYRLDTKHSGMIWGNIFEDLRKAATKSK